MTDTRHFVHLLCSEIAKTFPGSVAVQEEGRLLTYSDLELKAGRLSHLLHNSAAAEHTVIGIMLPPSIELVISMLAVFRTGAIYLPIDPKFHAKRMDQIFARSKPDIMIVHHDWKDEITSFLQERDLTIPPMIVTGDMTVSDLVTCCNCVGEETTSDLSEYEPVTYPSLPEDGSYIFYTSGSSGEAKAILGCHISLAHFIQWEIREFEIGPGHRISQLTQMTFDASLRDIFTALCSGATLCLPSDNTRNNIPRLIGWLTKMEITLAHCVPSLFRALTKTLQSMDEAGSSFPMLRYMLLAGEILYAKDLFEWRKVMGEKIGIVNLYGATETTLVKTFHRIGSIPADGSQTIHVGKPIDNTFIAIINDGALCRIGEIGEVYIKTPFATKGYYKDPELTATVFVQNPLLKDKKDIVYRTGDLGRYLPERNIEILGRLDNQVKISGIRVELNEVEMAMLTLNGVGQVVVKAHRMDDNQQDLICYYTGDERGSALFHSLLQPLLPAYAIPGHFIWLENFPLNLNGKIDKRALPLPESAVQESDYAAPCDELEQKLEKIWKDILGLKRIGRDRSFFTVGGHSLRAIQLLSRIFSDLHTDLKIADIFTFPTIEQQAALIRSAGTQIFADIPVANSGDGLHPASNGQRRLWTLSQLEDTNNAYNMASAYVIEGPLDRIAFEKAFAGLIIRHAILRTTFIYQDGMLMQKVHPPSAIPFDLRYRDNRGQKPAGEDGSIRSVLDQEASVPFDLENGPLLKTFLFHLEENKYIFLLVMHHIIADEWSVQILVRDISILYNAYRHNRTPDLAEPPLQYKDFSAWHNQLLDSDRGEADRRYWMDQFADTAPALTLPTDHARPHIFSSNGNALDFMIGAGTVRRLSELGRKEGSTLFMILLSAVCVMIYRRTGQRDLVIGSPMAGRIHIDLEDMIGLFINPLPIRVRFPEAETFSDLLTIVRTTALEVYSHQLYSLDKLSADVPGKRDFSRSMFFDVAVMLQNVAEQDYDGQAFEQLKISYLPTAVMSKHDWEFYFNERGEVISLTIIYNTDLYNVDTVNGIGNELLRILEEVAADPFAPVATVRPAEMLAERTRPISNTF